MATPMRTSNSGSAAGTRVPGGPSGNVDTTVMTKSPESTMMRTAWTACSTVSPRFHVRRLASRSRVTPLATGEPDSVPTEFNVTETKPFNCWLTRSSRPRYTYRSTCMDASPARLGDGA